MDGNRFDALAKSIAGLQSRRGLLRSLGLALGAGAVGAIALDGNGSDAATCRPGGTLCRTAGECCSGTCTPDATGRGRCGCEAGTTPCAPNACCQSGQECVNGVCRYPTPTATPTNTPTSTPTNTPTNTPTATATNTPLNGCAAPGSDGAACGEGVCVGGECCTNGPLASEDFCNPILNTAVCCAAEETCCALHGCCRDCFRYSSSTDGSAILGYVYECCREEELCPPRTSPTDNPPYCCSGSASVCVHGRADVPDGCYRPEQVCADGSVCEVPCCGDTCCGLDTTCANGQCLPANRACKHDADCDSGERCAGATYRLELVCTGTPGESDYNCNMEEQVVADGVCCGSRQVASHFFEPNTQPYSKNTCCPSNEVVGSAPAGSRGDTCCSFAEYERCNACHNQCTPNGRISRF